MEPTSSRKIDKTTWIVLAVVLVLLCCLLVAGLVGAYIYLEQKGTLTLPGIAGPAPTAVRATVTPTPYLGPLVVEPFDPTDSPYDTLQNLAPGWEDSTSPGSQEWQVSVSPGEPVLVFMGWCTSTTTILEQNYQHLRWSLKVDGQAVNVYGLFLLNESDSDGACRTYGGLIRQWPAGQHTISTTMELTTAVNDGWGDYPAGLYADNYHVTVKP